MNINIHINIEKTCDASPNNHMDHEHIPQTKRCGFAHRPPSRLTKPCSTRFGGRTPICPRRNYTRSCVRRGTSTVASLGPRINDGPDAHRPRGSLKNPPQTSNRFIPLDYPPPLTGRMPIGRSLPLTLNAFFTEHHTVRTVTVVFGDGTYT